MEEALRAALLADGGVAGIVAGRVNWGLRSATLPAARLQMVGDAPIYTFGGRADLTPYRVQIESFGARYGDAKRLDRAIEAALETLARPAFDAVFRLSGGRDDTDTDAAGNPVHRVSSDYQIWHRS